MSVTVIDVSPRSMRSRRDRETPDVSAKDRTVPPRARFFAVISFANWASKVPISSGFCPMS
nr:MAG TPA: hypothetical protein [Caudoviricetes sp.]DAZ10754.1 MAG TPA: hypothetical protein [Caudoviricetes sp.]